MDPAPSEILQHKTSPNSDPAALMQLTTELTAQASQLALHQHQLQRLTTLTEKLVTALQGLRITQPQAAANPPPAPANPPAMQTPPVSPRLAFPDIFDGDSTKCKGFLLQCSLFVNQQPSLYPTESSRTAFVCSLSSAKLWTGLLRYGGPMVPPSLPSTHFSITSGRCLNIQLREEARVSSFLHSHKAGELRSIMCYHSALWRHKLRGWRIP